MKRDIRAIALIKQTSGVYNACVILGAVLVSLLIYFLLSDEKIVSFSEFIEIVVGIIALLYLCMNSFLKVIALAEEMPRALSFGMTRRKVFIYSRITDFLEVLFIAVLAIIFVKEFSALLFFKAAALCFGIIMWIEGVAGNAIIRYGKKAYITYYVFLFAIFIGVPRAIGHFKVVRDIFMNCFEGFVSPDINQVYIWGALLTVAGLGLLINWITFRKIPVTASV